MRSILLALCLGRGVLCAQDISGERKAWHDIAFTFLVGIVTSTFSAIFIAAQIFYLWHKGDRKHVEAHQDIAPKYEWAGTSRASE